MADFCHAWEPEGLGCLAVGCTSREHDGRQCFGDFTPIVRSYTRGHGELTLEPEHYALLGICEGHGGTTALARDADGVLWFEHTRDGMVVEEPPRVRVEEGAGT